MLISRTKEADICVGLTKPVPETCRDEKKSHRSQCIYSPNTRTPKFSFAITQRERKFGNKILARHVKPKGSSENVQDSHRQVSILNSQRKRQTNSKKSEKRSSLGLTSIAAPLAQIKLDSNRKPLKTLQTYGRSVDYSEYPLHRASLDFGMFSPKASIGGALDSTRKNSLCNGSIIREYTLDRVRMHTDSSIPENPEYKMNTGHTLQLDTWHVGRHHRLQHSVEVAAFPSAKQEARINSSVLETAEVSKGFNTLQTNDVFEENFKLEQEISQLNRQLKETELKFTSLSKKHSALQNAFDYVCNTVPSAMSHRVSIMP